MAIRRENVEDGRWSIEDKRMQEIEYGRAKIEVEGGQKKLEGGIEDRR